MNAMTGIAFLGVWRAESMTGLLGGIAVGFTLLSVSHQFKKRGYRNAGRERLRVGPVLPVAPANSGMFALGILFFVICGLAMLVIPEFSQLTRIAMTVRGTGQPCLSQAGPDALRPGDGNEWCAVCRRCNADVLWRW
jgi:hypothetical protein